jgi:transposase
LLLQHLEDISDRALERFLQENTAAKWFCNFALSDKTPTYSIFSKMRTTNEKLFEQAYNTSN